MIKGVFLYGNENLDSKFRLNGIDKKVKAQILALNSEKIKCTQLCFPSEKENLLYKFKIRFPFFNNGPKWRSYSEIKDLDFIYFRRPLFFSIYTIKWLKQVKVANPNIKILLEIPTYPYDKEIKEHWIDCFFLWKDKFNRRKLCKYVDRIVTIEDSDIIFGIPTIKMINGIDVNLIDPIKPVAIKDDIIHIIMVAMFTSSHGLDRFLVGLGEYYQKIGKRNIILHIVGSGSKRIMKEYRDLVEKYNIEKHVMFHGLQYGNDLDKIYNKCQLGLIAFGTHRKNIFRLSTLKSREYLAKGLPMVSSGNTDVFENEMFYYNLECPSDEKPIAINTILDFYDRIYSREEPLEVISKIRKFAIEHVDIHVTMRPVIDYLS